MICKQAPKVLCLVLRASTDHVAKMSAPAPTPDLSHIDTWVFDLDNTLYPAESNLFTQVAQRMGLFIADHFGIALDEAKAIQKRFFLEYGTTLNGLMTEHGMDPAPYLAYVHDIDLSVVPVDRRLDDRLADLPGRKLIFTNASAEHAENVLRHLGIRDHFEAIVDIIACDYKPKPDPAGYRRLLQEHGVAPTRAIFFEDTARNLRPAHDMGMATAWLPHRGKHRFAFAHEDSKGDHIHHVVDDLIDWLGRVVDASGRD